MDITRVCAAIIKGDKILMVYHQDKDRNYWTFPGGGVDSGETPEQAIVREVLEETGLNSEIVKFLFDSDFKGNICRCFLMKVDESQEIKLGYDPEESHLDSQQKMLQNISWLNLESVKDDFQVAQAIKSLN